MRMLSEQDLRWVSGGFCSMWGAEDSDVASAETDYINAHMDETLAYMALLALSPSHPDYAAACTAYADAQSASSAAFLTYSDYYFDNQNHAGALYQFYTYGPPDGTPPCDGTHTITA